MVLREIALSECPFRLPEIPIRPDSHYTPHPRTHCQGPHPSRSARRGSYGTSSLLVHDVVHKTLRTPSRRRRAVQMICTPHQESRRLAAGTPATNRIRLADVLSRRHRTSVSPCHVLLIRNVVSCLRLAAQSLHEVEKLPVEVQALGA